MKKIKSGICLLLFSLFLAQPSYAGCKSDCSETYESARDDCINLYDAPDDADDLQMCIDDAKTEYDDCVDECDN